MANIKDIIEKAIKDSVQNNVYKTVYKEPIVSFVDADNELFTKLKEVAHKDHLMPYELLEGAKTVVAYFIPFTKDLVDANRSHEYVSPRWALAYVETNRLIGDINFHIKDMLGKKGVKVSTLPATHNFDEETIMSKWSHRHVAYIAGLGKFGINNLLISEKGSAGRYGSFVVDINIESKEIKSNERCLYKIDESCTYCFDNCPVDAFSFDNFDRQKCYNYLLEVLDSFKDIDALCDVCGKCNCGPCAIL